MCGIVGLLLAAEDGHANQELFDSLTALQHRGQGKTYHPRSSPPRPFYWRVGLSCGHCVCFRSAREQTAAENPAGWCTFQNLNVGSREQTIIAHIREHRGERTFVLPARGWCAWKQALA